jgi:hypothetical protein
MLFLYSAIDVLVIGDYVVRKPSDFAARMVQFNKLVAQQSAAGSGTMPPAPGPARNSRAK